MHELIQDKLNLQTKFQDSTFESILVHDIMHKSQNKENWSTTSETE